MPDMLEFLKEYDEWKMRKSFAQPANAPEDFLSEQRMTRIVGALSRHVSDPADDRYPIEEYLLEDDVDWLKAQGSTAVSVAGEE